jgi:hypothetical protein
VRFAVEGWAPEYGAPMDDAAMVAPAQPADLDVEVPVEDWAPRRPGAATSEPESVLFVDGVRRVEARVWVTSDDGHGHDEVHQGICASYASGAVRCDGRAALVHARVARGLFCPARDAEPVVTRHGTFPLRAVSGDDFEQLSLSLQQRMGELEAEVAAEVAGAADLVVVDGPLKAVGGAVGYIKTHHVGYLPAELQGAVAALAPGERTPLFVTTSRRWSRYSWYQRLPGAEGHPWAGVIRAEVDADQTVAAAAARADQVATVLPRFASQAHKDPRAPQNLHPIAGLERELRRRLGDPAVLYRALRVAAAEDR